MSLQKISNNLFQMILENLSIEDALRLSMVCRKLFKYIQNNNLFFLKSFMKSFLPKEMDNFYDFYQDPVFQIKFFGKYSERLFIMSKTPIWKNIISQKYILMKKWWNFFQQFSSLEFQKISKFLQNLNESFQGFFF